MKLAFITTNKHKFEEASEVMSHFGIELEHLNIKYEEDHEEDIADIAGNAAKKMAEKYNKPIVLEDTGLFFNAYPEFPGAIPKYVFNTLGYKGILKLLEGEDRGAYFKTIVAYCEPKQKPILFEGTMKGHFTEKVFNLDIDAMPYDRIFIPESKSKTISDMNISEKNSLSQRSKAFKKLGKYLITTDY